MLRYCKGTRVPVGRCSRLAQGNEVLQSLIWTWHKDGARKAREGSSAVLTHSFNCLHRCYLGGFVPVLAGSFQIPPSLENSFSFAQAAEMVSATGLVLSGKLPTTTTILAKVRAGDLDPKLQPVSLLLARMETCPTCQLWISLLIRNNIDCNLNLTLGWCHQTERHSSVH